MSSGCFGGFIIGYLLVGIIAGDFLRRLMSSNWWNAGLWFGVACRNKLGDKEIRSTDSKGRGCSTSCPT
jgi:hypothetical protein